MFQVLHSSAGAGKTHALVKHYLAHCLRGEDPSAYRQVLALTFTNKAATEMKERVMHYLQRIAAGEQGSAQIDDVVAHLMRSAKTDADTVAARADAVLGHMLHHWSDVAISTIDAFTRRVVRPFARDLQLDHELRMTTDEVYYRERAVEQLIGEAGSDATVTGLLTEACLQLLEEERKWDPEKPLRELSSELTKEGSIKPLEMLRGIAPETVAPLARKLRGEIAAFEQRIQALGQEAMHSISEAHVAVEHVAYGKSGIHGYFRKLANFAGERPEPGRNVLAPITTGKWHSGKADAAAIAALETLAPMLESLFRNGEELLEAGFAHYAIRRAVLRELPTAFALHALDERLEGIKRAEGITFFSDLTRKVAAVVKHEPVPFIHERMGERYRHFLIDEFQDTSLLQWNALLPLIDNALGSGGSALLVGDAKQAIYRWRNGEVRLFTGFPKIFGRDPHDTVEAEREDSLVRNHRAVEPLADNFRSAGTIIQFNNELFGELAATLPESLRPVYDEHAQGVRRTGDGMVLLEKLPGDVKGEERHGAMRDFVLRHVQEALTDGFAPGDIAVLVRSKEPGRQVAGHLVAHGIAVVSPDGLRLSSDPVVAAIMDQLRFLHTGDVTAAARVVQYLGMQASPAEQEVVYPFNGQDGLPDPVAMVREHLAAHGNPRLRTTLTALVNQLAQAMGHRAGADAQLLTLLDEIHAWSSEHGQDLGGFLEHFERSGGERGSAPPAHGHAVQVMTVHASKGLQFPVVIVPNATMSSAGFHAERLWVEPGDAVPELPMALVRESKILRAANTPELEEEDQLRCLDAINLLYVAFTRAEQRLITLVHEQRPDSLSKALLARMAVESTSDGSLRIGERTPPWNIRATSDAALLEDVSGTRPAEPILRFEAPEDWDPADPDPFRAHGNAVHEVLARTHAAEDLDQAIASVVSEGLLEEEKAGTLRTQLHALLSRPDLAPWFGKGLQVRNEATIITADGKALRPDRIVIDGPTVRVLDIKTGRPADPHPEQVRTYMQLLGELGHTRVEGALLYVSDGRLEAVEA